MSKRSKVLRFAGMAGVAAIGLVTYGRYAIGRFERLEPGSAEAPGSYVDVDGVRIHCVEAGEGEPVVLVHGLNASTYAFRYIIPELAQRYRAVALDLKGFGHSERPAKSDYSLSAQADSVAGAMTQLGIESAMVVGHSMGGAVAMRVALRYPERVKRLVLVDSASDREFRRGLGVAPLLRLGLFLALPFTLHSRRYQQLALRAQVHDPALLTPEFVEAHFRSSRMKGHQRALGALMADRRRDEPLAPEKIGAPTLILWGEHDRFLPPEVGEELAGRIPSARLELVPSSGHLPLEEQPGYCSRALLNFLGSEEPLAHPKEGPSLTVKPAS